LGEAACGYLEVRGTPAPPPKASYCTARIVAAAIRGGKSSAGERGSVRFLAGQFAQWLLGVHARPHGLLVFSSSVSVTCGGRGEYMLRDAKMGFDGWAPMPAREMVAGVALLRGGTHRDGFFRVFLLREDLGKVRAHGTGRKG
jgi:hypothetical protein